MKLSDLKHGQRCTCTIDEVKIEDARISISSNGHIYICQNEVSGFEATAKLGYKFGWRIYHPGSGKSLDNYLDTEMVTDLKLVEKTNSLDRINTVRNPIDTAKKLFAMSSVRLSKDKTLVVTPHDIVLVKKYRTDLGGYNITDEEAKNLRDALNDLFPVEV